MYDNHWNVYKLETLIMLFTGWTMTAKIKCGQCVSCGTGYNQCIIHEHCIPCMKYKTGEGQCRLHCHGNGKGDFHLGDYPRLNWAFTKDTTIFVYTNVYNLVVAVSVTNAIVQTQWIEREKLPMLASLWKVLLWP